MKRILKALLKFWKPAGGKCPSCKYTGDWILIRTNEVGKKYYECPSCHYTISD